MLEPDKSNGYEEQAATFMRARNVRIGQDVVRGWVRDWVGELATGAEVLELGCGHGVISEVLVEAGVSLYAVDASETLLRAFQERFPAVETECGAVQDSAFFGRTFDAAVAWGIIFLLPEETQFIVLVKVANALRPGGRFLFTATREPLTWKDSLTERESVSLGAAEYETLLRGLGLEVLPGCTDEGENYYIFARKP